MVDEKKSKGIRRIYLLYWIMLAYILAALVWWFIELNRQNDRMVSLQYQIKGSYDGILALGPDTIESERKRKVAQYIGEGATFFLLIALAALFFFRAVKKQFKISRQQQHFMMAVTHELKTPIAVSALNLETIKKRELEKGQQDKLISNTIVELQRLNTLCNNMLLSSQMESEGYRVMREETNLSDLAGKCVSDFSNRFPERKFSFSGEAEIPVSGDGFLLEMAVNNLLDNAVKYSPKDSTIRVEVTTNGEKANLSVFDEGQGIQKEERNMIFEKFYRTGNDATRNAKGTGLGLFIVGKVAETHGGDVHVDDNRPKGSVFTLSLPLLT